MVEGSNRALPLPRFIEAGLKLGRYCILAAITLVLILLISVLLRPPVQLLQIGSGIAAGLFWIGVAILLGGALYRRTRKPQ